MDIAPQAPKITERTFAFAVSVVRFCQKLVTKPGVNRTLGQQLLRAGTSIGANLEEAQAAQSSADFISKCSISLKEARETIYWLRLLQAAGQCENDDCRLLAQEADEISRIIGAIIVNTKTRRKDK
ncbi:MAG: four helix bundle protein [Candidatus Binatia bacterium]